METKHNLVHLKYYKQIIRNQQLCALTPLISTSNASSPTAALVVKDVQRKRQSACHAPTNF